MSDKNIEASIRKWHYRLELIRTVIPLITLGLQLIILYHILGK